VASSPPGSASDDGFGNRLLDALPAEETARLRPLLSCQQVDMKHLLLDRGQPIDAVYFPVRAVVSWLTTLVDRGGVEIATIGNEGVLGSPLLLGSGQMPAREFAQVQIPGEVWRLAAADFQAELARQGPFQAVIQRYVQALFSQVSQQVACNGVHSIEERCCRWLLLTHDRVGTDEFPLTQEFLSEMLGVRRASVTIAAGTLQKAGFIRYRRGRLTVLDREGLEGASCECYGIIRQEFDRLLGPLDGLATRQLAKEGIRTGTS
jgi:CRP-like cAMP-binding protein